MLLWSWCLFTAIETLSKTEVVTRDLAITVTDMTMFLFGGPWTLELWVREAAEHFKQGLMGHPC